MKYNFEKLEKGLKKKWIAALKSGKYLQGEQQLKQGRGETAKFCCLGVLAEVCGVTNLREEGYFQKRRNIRGITKVPKQLIGAEGLPFELAQMNDKKGWSFTKIGNWIEKYL